MTEKTSLPAHGSCDSCDGQISTVWQRTETAGNPCGFGSKGICCRICNMGPCRISPKTPVGICGADADTIAARNLVREIVAGVSAHSDHGRHLVHTLKMVAQGSITDYAIKDELRLREAAADYGIDTTDKSINEIALALVEIFEKEFAHSEKPLKTLSLAPQKRFGVWDKNDIAPTGIDSSVVEMMHRTHMGVDHAHEHLLLGGIKTALADGWGGSMIATTVSDILFGTPRPVRTMVNLGVLADDKVNIIVHGHEPVLSEMIAIACSDRELIDYAKSKGAQGIQLAGICCTANEILMRHGIPAAGSFLQQELAIMTGAVEMMMVDVHYIMPGLATVAKCFHTEIVSTSSIAATEGFTPANFDIAHAAGHAKQLVKQAIDNFPNRNRDKVCIPDEKMELVAGFSVRTVFEMLGGRFRASFRPLNDAIIDGRIRGVVAVIGCNNPRDPMKNTSVDLVMKLIAADCLVLMTGCTAMACARAGLLTPETAFSHAGHGLREVCEAVGIPPVLHMGSCVDNSRLLSAATEVVNEGGLGDDIADLPLAGAAPEWVSEKAVAIGHYFVGSGVYVMLGSPLRLEGGKRLHSFITDGVEAVTGGKFAWANTVDEQIRLILEHIDKKRVALGIQTKRERKLLGMKERRELNV
ncbi:MAG: anaerobic carbon-monoxide dehydrogenase catalytic subunit [Chitinispirillaceae bacterium]|nr:anaerobic carbon-monoxide dehydrogenase catalytic subunit [Chitinispirillaceae bacterium]